MKKLKIIGCVTAILLTLYVFVSYTSLNPIAKYRDLYIETAMSTMTHQYLAKIFPQGVIDRVMNDVEQKFEDNKVPMTLPLDQAEIMLDMANRKQEALEEIKSWEKLQDMFPELDIEPLKQRYETNEIANLDIEKPDFPLKTIHGDSVYALNIPEGILIINLKTSSYNGMLAISKHPESTILGKTRSSGRGETITEMCGKYNAILGINASGFYDPGGRGLGDRPVGLVLSQGNLSGERMYGRYQIAGMDLNNNFVAGTDLDLNNMRDAMQFYPILISEGENRTDSTFGLGIQPRTCIGQNKLGDMMFLIIDGRQVGHSIGITVPECTEILLKYNCYIAMNMDGGSSASMTYKDKMITKTSSPTKTGRYLPDAWLVLRQNQESEE